MQDIFKKSLNNQFSPYIIIALVVIVFNLVAIWGLDTLLGDDYLRYRHHGINDVFPAFKFKRVLLSPFINQFLTKMMVISTALARSLILVLFMVPLSWAFYYLLNKMFYLPRSAAIAAAVIPNILPGQERIPAYIAGSYTPPGLLFAVISLILALKYLKAPTSTGRDLKYLFFSILMFFAASQSMGEHVVFLFPPFILVIWLYGFTTPYGSTCSTGCSPIARWVSFFSGILKKVYTSNSKRKLLLSTSFGLIILFKFYQILSVYRNLGRPHRLSLDQIIQRLKIACGQRLLPVKFDNTFINEYWIPLTGLLIFIIVLSFIMNMNRPGLIIKSTRRHNFAPAKRNVTLLYAFFITWSVSTSFVFIFFSKLFTSRYFYIPAFAVNALLVLAIFSICAWFFPGKRKIYIPALIFLILLSGCSRYFSLKKFYSFYNKINNPIVNKIKQISFPENSQIVIVGIKKRRESGKVERLGNWASSSGYLTFITRRKDITGLVGKEYSYYDPFVPLRGIGRKNIMTGLSPDKPLFLFRIVPRKKKLTRLEYCLQWQGRTKNAHWVLYRTDKKSGKIIRIKSGRGFLPYDRSIKEIGIKKSGILWGGTPPWKIIKK